MAQTTTRTAQVIVADYQPGNGTLYLMVHGHLANGDPFVAIPNLQRAAVMGWQTPHVTYVMEKLQVGEADAHAIVAYLTGTPLAEEWIR